MDILTKIERGFASYLATRLTGLTIRRARDAGEPVDGPLLLLLASDPKNHPDTHPSEGCYLATLTLALRFHSDGNKDAALEAISAALFDIASAQTHLNKQQNAVDKRPFCAFHLHHINPTSGDLRPEGSDWEEVRSVELTVVSADQTFPAADPSYFRRPGGTDRYLRPDGTSHFLRAA